jgi:hypothetical protein
MIRFPTHDGRGGFSVQVTSHVSSECQSSGKSDLTAHAIPSLVTPTTDEATTPASVSSSFLDEVLTRQPQPSIDLRQRVVTWLEGQQMSGSPHKRRKLSPPRGDQMISNRGLEGWLWRFVSTLIGIDDQILQIVLGEQLLESTEKTFSDASTPFLESLVQRTSFEKHLASPFLAPHFQRYFKHEFDAHAPSSVHPSTHPMDSHRETLSHRLPPPPKVSSSWSSIPQDPIQTAPFQPSPLHLLQSDMPHPPWGIDDDGISSSAEHPDDYWDREITLPIVWHLVKNFISAKLPSRFSEEDGAQTMRSCKEESVHSRWDEPEERYYWHESIDGASSVGLGGIMGHWGEV